MRRLDLGRQAGAANQDDDITLDDARFLVAREHGFEDWDALVGFYASLPGEASRLTSKPVGVLAAGDDSESDQAPRWQSRDWGAVLAYLKESDSQGIDASGQMTDAMLDHASRLEHITALALGGSKELTDAGLEHLARLPRLRHLDLSGTGITDGGLEVLRHCRRSRACRWRGRESRTLALRTCRGASGCATSIFRALQRVMVRCERWRGRRICAN